MTAPAYARAAAARGEIRREVRRQDAKIAKQRDLGRLAPAGRGPLGALREAHLNPLLGVLGGSPSAAGTRPALLAVLLCALVACGPAADTTQAPSLTAPADAIAKTTENGPVKATVKVWPAKPALGDAIYLRLEVAAPSGIRIDAPFQEAGDQRLGRFRVVGFVRDTKALDGGGTLEEQTYTLEAPSSGRHRIPPLRLEMLDARAGSTAGTGPQEILTDEVPLEVAPVPTEQATRPLEPALGALDPEVGKTSWLVIVGLVAGALALAVGALLGARAVRSRRRIQKQRSAYDEAVAQLRALEHRGAPDASTADAWFVELSAIVRRYLEHRYEIRAPELTTEEFLQVATARPELTAEHRAMLTSFLERCDRADAYRLLPDDEVQEAADLALRVGLRAGLLHAPDGEHLAVQRGELFERGLDQVLLVVTLDSFVVGSRHGRGHHGADHTHRPGHSQPSAARVWCPDARLEMTCCVSGSRSWRSPSCRSRRSPSARRSRRARPQRTGSAACRS